jgi:hypothetical protein
MPGKHILALEFSEILDPPLGIIANEKGAHL